MMASRHSQLVVALLTLIALVAGCSSEYRGSSAGAPKLGAANDLSLIHI